MCVIAVSVITAGAPLVSLSYLNPNVCDHSVPNSFHALVLVVFVTSICACKQPSGSSRPS